jgi:hypothetical protein
MTIVISPSVSFPDTQPLDAHGGFIGPPFSVLFD